MPVEETSAQPSVARPPTNMSAWVALPVVVFASLAVLFGAALRNGDPSKLPSALIGKPAPNQPLSPIEGTAALSAGLTVADFGPGPVRLVNFFASWCPPCLDEHDLLMTLSGRSDLKLLGINYKDQAAPARRFLAKNGNPYAQIGTDPNGRAAIDWGVYGSPESFLLDTKGTIVWRHAGPLSPEIVATEIEPLIARATGKTAPKS